MKNTKRNSRNGKYAGILFGNIKLEMSLPDNQRKWKEWSGCSWLSQLFQTISFFEDLTSIFSFWSILHWKFLFLKFYDKLWLSISRLTFQYIRRNFYFIIRFEEYQNACSRMKKPSTWEMYTYSKVIKYLLQYYETYGY